MTAPDNLPGKQIDEYHIEQLLGSGGMARVYRALDTRLRRYVALKVIAPDFGADSNYHVRFEREAQSIARLEHPNIVRIYRFGEASGLYYLAMEYVEGADLDWLIGDYKKHGEVMPLGSVSRILAEIGSALDYAHSKQVIHRDVKPGNIIVDKTGRAVLTDFGLALLADIGTRGEVLGSPHYIAPEQAILSSNVVPQSDLYSLGVTLFEILTGELPFTGGAPMDIAMRQVSEPPPPPSTFNTAIPHPVDEVVLRLLAKEPGDRYTTGAELSAAFQQAIAHWQPSSPLAAQTARRPSLVAAPEKVYERMASAPLPALPPAPPTISPDTEPGFTGTAATVAHRVEDRTQPAVLREPIRAQRGWLYPALFAIGIFSVGVIGLLATLAVRNNEVAVLPAVPALTSTVTPSEPPATETPTALPTDLPTPTALILPTTPDEMTNPPVVNATSQPPTVAPVTPSVKTLAIRLAKDWVAFVNTGALPISLAGFQLHQGDRSLSGADWGKSSLLPGECLRIYSNKLPKDLPKDCTLPFDYQGNKNDRDHWVKDKTTVVVNPFTQYCYPSNQCNE